MTVTAEKLKEAKEQNKRLVVVISKGTLDMAYPPLILATTASAMEMEVDLYFTFWGMHLISKKTADSIMLSSVGNPGMPIPNILGVLPGMTRLATFMMKRRIKKYWPTVGEMLREAKEMGARIHACSPTMGLMGIEEGDLIPEVDDIIGASAYLDLAADDAITLFI